ncbi:MAG: hypothetical protein AAFU60_05510, partial [Bacteroidota bacterium]
MGVMAGPSLFSTRTIFIFDDGIIRTLFSSLPFRMVKSKHSQPSIYGRSLHHFKESPYFARPGKGIDVGTNT